MGKVLKSNSLQVPGRMGMLVTLYLISANVYNSLDAPASRGFRSGLFVYISGELAWFPVPPPLARPPRLEPCLDFGLQYALTKNNRSKKLG